MAIRKLTLGCLYPDIMSAHGDRGNVAAIVRRCGWRGIDTEVWELSLGDPVDADDLDLLVIGNGGEPRQRLVAPDLAEVKGPGLREAVAQGAALLAVGGGYELLGRYYQPSRGVELPGAGLFDTWAIRHGDDLSPACSAVSGSAASGSAASSGPAGRVIGGLLVRWGGEFLVGYENHSARTYLGPTAHALGHVITGHGNNGDGREGVRLGSAVGTYLRGPCLPRNPALADFLIRGALLRRYGDARLQPLPDKLEMLARQTAVRGLGAPARTWQRNGAARALCRW